MKMLDMTIPPRTDAMLCGPGTDFDRVGKATICEVERVRHLDRWKQQEAVPIYESDEVPEGSIWFVRFDPSGGPPILLKSVEVYEP